MTLPVRQEEWFSAWTGRSSPEERRASCESCAMCVRPGQEIVGIWAFKPDRKCCGTVPVLPNWLVGDLLRDQDPRMADGQRTMRARISGRAGVGPLFVAAPPKDELLMAHTFNVLGRSETIRCPHFVHETGGCGIWRHRNHLCATWFCKHERGGTGLQFWQATKVLFQRVERGLAVYCADQLGLPIESLASQLVLANDYPDPRKDSDDVDGIVGEAQWNRRFGPWAGRPEAWFEACSEVVEGLSPEEVLAITGPEAQSLVKIVSARHDALVDGGLPERLIPGTWNILGVNAGALIVMGYSGSDPVQLPHAVVAALHNFDGRPLVEVRASLAAEGLALRDEDLRVMLDFGILKAA